MIEEVCVDDYDVLVIFGGFEEFGFYDEVYDLFFLNLIREFNLKEKIIVFICVVVLLVGKSGVLKNCKVIIYYLKNGKR